MPPNIIVFVSVKTGAPVSEVVSFTEGELKVKVHAVREKGKANKALIELLATFFNTSKNNIEIVSGHTSSRKKVIIRK